MMNMLRVTVLAFLLATAAGYRSYQGNIPNGNTVPHPCKPGAYWDGVGHFSDAGNGDRNPFGVDFKSEGLSWTPALCRKDSDGDGKTNGEELGDPNCQWTKNGSLPPRSSGLSHPGVCDPWYSLACLGKSLTNSKYQTQGLWLTDLCKTTATTLPTAETASPASPCPGITDTGIRNITLSLPAENKVPVNGSSLYTCQMFDLNTVMVSIGDYHLLAVEPVLDNANLIQKIVLLGCTGDSLIDPEPYECHSLEAGHCDTVLSIVPVGLKVDCLHPAAGIRIGINGYRNLGIQVHYNYNPNQKSTLTDSSGVKLYYTPDRRGYDAGVFKIGLEQFVLPPLKSSVQRNGTCTSACTRSLIRGPVYVTRAWNFMNYTGVKVSIEVRRGNSSVVNLTKDDSYSYDNPKMTMFPESPVQILPGDELVTRCEYNTMRVNNRTQLGESSDDQMCYGFLMYYPKENIASDDCVGSGPNILGCDPGTYRGCPSLQKYSDHTYPEAARLYSDMTLNCPPRGHCVPDCLNTIMKHRKENPCLRDEIFDYIKEKMWKDDIRGADLVSRFTSCDAEVKRVSKSKVDPQSSTITGNNSVSLISNVIVLLVSLVYAFRRNYVH